MRTDWRSVSIGPDAMLRDALAVIDRGRLGLALVVDSDRRLLGTVTDGDLRRAILRGLGLEARAAEIMTRQFTFVGPDESAAGVMEIMRFRSLRQIPVLDDHSRVAGVYLLDDLLGPVTRSNWVVVMAGGEGRRLRPLTFDTPKPMLRVGDRPLLENTMALLGVHGFRRVFLAINYLGEQIEAHFGNGRQFGVEIDYLREVSPLGTAGALSLLPSLPDVPVLVLNGDLLTEVDLTALMDYHEHSGCAVTQAVREYIVQIPYGVVQCEDGKVTAVEEKPVHRILVNAGIYVLAPQVFEVVPSGECSIVELLDLARSRGHLVAAFPVRERWHDIGYPDDYHRVRHGWMAEPEQS